MTTDEDDNAPTRAFSATGAAQNRGNEQPTRRPDASQPTHAQPSAAGPSPATAQDGEAKLLAGGVLDGRYRLVDKLGEGGMGSVYLVDDLLLRRKVALKTLRLDGISGEEDLERFRKEAAITHAIHHPNVARTYDIGEEGGVHYMSMEWLAGETLMDRLRGRGRLGAAEVRRLAVPLCLGLRAAHRAGIVHRDLKPANIMLVSDERALVIMDFGIAASISESHRTIAAVANDGSKEGVDSPWQVTSAGRGTPAYMSPEQWDGVQGDARTDIYALGVILYVALTAKPPFRGPTTAELAAHHRSTPAPDVRAEVPDVDRDLAALIGRCLAKRPDDRPATMEVVLDVLRRGQRRRSWLRSLAVTALLTALLTFAVDAAIFNVVGNAVLHEMKPGMSRLAQLVARDMAVGDLEQLHGPADMTSPAFARVSGRLARAKRENPDIKGIYVMREDVAAGDFVFVADAQPFDVDRDGNGVISADERGAPTGQRYNGSAYPAMHKTLKSGRPQTDEAFAVDAWGVSLSGYAPVGINGAVAQMFVGVDVGNKHLSELRRRLNLVLSAVAVAVVLVAAALTFPLQGGQTLWRRFVGRRLLRRDDAVT